MSTSQMRNQDNAARLLKKAAAVSKDARLLRIASQLSAGGHFDEVIEAIDKMGAMLKEEEADDLKQKETCEEDRATDTRDAIKTARSMDEMTESITALKAEIEEIKKNIVENEDEIKKNKDELAELTKIREEENKEYLSAKAASSSAFALRYSLF